MGRVDDERGWMMDRELGMTHAARDTSSGDCTHQHCWHGHRGPLLMVIPDGHIVQKCCKCPVIRTIHSDHA